MPRKALVSKEDAVRTIEKFIEHFRTDELPKFTSQVWVDMSKDLNDKWSSHGVYIAVRENRRGILSEARKNQGIIMPEEEENDNALPSSTSGSSVPKLKKKPDIESQVKAHLKSLKSWLYLTLDGDTWNKVKPRITYKYGERQDTYVTASPTNWTEAIFAAFAKEFHFPCAYILKRAKIHDSRDSLHYMEIYAECKSRKCSNRFLGFVDKEPWYGEPLDIKIKTWDTSLDEHEIVHRPIQAVKRRRVEDDDTEIEETPEVENNRNKRAAKKIWSECTTKMEEQQQQQHRHPHPHPHHHHHHHHHKDEPGREFEMDDPEVGDLAASIKELMTMPEYHESIQQIGLVPFSVIYTTPRQMHVYNEYCNAEASSSIKIEMKKDIVRKIMQGNASDTRDVYLLSMILKLDVNSFMAYQMISEKIDYPLVMYWLGSWFENGARKPREAISNYCRVFLSAMCLAFNGFSLESYIHKQFAAVSGVESSDYQWPKSSSSPTRTSIRVDLRNLRSIVSHWRCFEKVNHPCIREFYIRCVDLMIEAKTFDEFTQLLSLTIVVAFNAREDAVLETMKLTPRMSRKKLEAIIAKNPQAAHDIAAFEGDNHPANDEPVLEDVFVDTDQLRPVTNWLEGLVKQAKSLKTQGSELNAFYLPEFAENLVSIALDFPLWTKFTASSLVQDDTCTRHVDQYFQDWQPRILAAVPAPQQFPIRADHFVKAHLDEINEAAANVQSVLTDVGLEPVIADAKTNIKHPATNVQVTMLRTKDSATSATSAASEYHIFDIVKSNTSDNDIVDEPPESKPSQIELNQNAKKKPATNRDNILSACIVETDELGVCHRRNISLDFSEL